MTKERYLFERRMLLEKYMNANRKISIGDYVVLLGVDNYIGSMVGYGGDYSTGNITYTFCNLKLDKYYANNKQDKSLLEEEVQLYQKGDTVIFFSGGARYKSILDSVYKDEDGFIHYTVLIE